MSYKKILELFLTFLLISLNINGQYYEEEEEYLDPINDPLVDSSI